jgi:LEA14-like dessication related protein
MTDEESAEIYEKMKAMFKQDMPNPEQEPIRFAYYMKLYKFYTEREKGEHN